MWVEQFAYKTFCQHGENQFCPSTSQRMRSYDQLPARARPAEVEAGTNGRWHLSGQPSAILRIPTPLPTPTATFEFFITKLDRWEMELLRQVTLSVDPFSLCLELTPDLSRWSNTAGRLDGCWSRRGLRASLLPTVSHTYKRVHRDALTVGGSGSNW